MTTPGRDKSKSESETQSWPIWQRRKPFPPAPRSPSTHTHIPRATTRCRVKSLAPIGRQRRSAVVYSIAPNLDRFPSRARVSSLGGDVDCSNYLSLFPDRSRVVSCAFELCDTRYTTVTWIACWGIDGAWFVCLPMRNTSCYLDCVGYDNGKSVCSVSEKVLEFLIVSCCLKTIERCTVGFAKKNM